MSEKSSNGKLGNAEIRRENEKKGRKNADKDSLFVTVCIVGQ